MYIKHSIGDSVGFVVYGDGSLHFGAVKEIRVSEDAVILIVREISEDSECWVNAEDCYSEPWAYPSLFMDWAAERLRVHTHTESESASEPSESEG